MSIKGLLEHAGPRDRLDQFDLGVSCVGDMEVADPVPGLPEIRALGVLCGKVVDVHEAADSHRFNEKLLGGRQISDDPGNLAERWSDHWLCHVFGLLWSLF